MIAVCDNAHEELPSDMPRIHWSISDPGRSSTAEAFDRTVDALTTRIDRLVRQHSTALAMEHDNDRQPVTTPG